MLADHVHRDAATTWWETESFDSIALVRFTQISVLRLLTTAAAMNDKPLSMKQAWHAYTRLFEDDRVTLLPEPDDLEREFKNFTSTAQASPKVWADGYLLAFAAKSRGTIITFDQALAHRGVPCIVLR